METPPDSPSELDQDAWDAQIAADVAAGRLDRLADAALAHLKAGRTREI